MSMYKALPQIFLAVSFSLSSESSDIENPLMCLLSFDMTRKSSLHLLRQKMYLRTDLSPSLTNFALLKW
jgi:hypothetical protein